MLSKPEAQLIAAQLAQQAGRFHSLPVSPEPAKASLEDHDEGRRILGGNSPFWAFTFRFELPPRMMMHPDFVRIVVDSETGKADFIPLK